MLKKIITILLCFGLSGCGIGGFWMTGNPFTSPPTPLSDYWEKKGVTVEKRRQDWVMCEGNDKGWYDVFEKVEGKEYNELSRKRKHEIQRCMLEKGYHYTGPCYDNEISIASPGCISRGGPFIPIGK